MKRLTIIGTDGKKKIVNIPTWCYGGDLSNGGGSSIIGPTVNLPVLFNITTGTNYTLSVHGTLGNEYIQIEPTALNTITPIVLYDNDIANYYTISVIGGLGSEFIQIDSIASITTTPLQLYNLDTLHYYNVSIIGIMRNETLQLDII